MAAYMPGLSPAQVILGAIAAREINIESTRWDLIAKRILDSNSNNIDNVAGSLVTYLESNELAMHNTQRESDQLIRDLAEITLFLKNNKIGKLNKIQKAILKNLNLEAQHILMNDCEKVTDFIGNCQRKLVKCISKHPIEPPKTVQKVSAIKTPVQPQSPARPAEIIMINHDNFGEMLGDAHKTGSKSLLQHCFDFIKRETNVTLTSDDSGLISIEVRPENNDSELNRFRNYFQTIVDSVEKQNIRINLSQGSNLSLENIKSFVNDTSSFIHTLDLKNAPKGNPIRDDDLKILLRNCPNLHHLAVSSPNITQEGLREINRLTSLETLELENCSNLTKLTLQTILTSLKSLVVGGCSRLTECNIPKNMTSLENIYITGCPKLSRLDLPDTLTSLETVVIDRCSSLRELNLPKKPTPLKSLNIWGCEKLTRLTVPSSSTSLQTLNLWNCPSLRELNLPDTLTSLETIDLRGCSNLQKLIFPRNLNHLQILSLEGCSKLLKLPLVGTMTALQVINCKECSGLSGMIIPETLTSLKSLDLAGCSDLPELRIPETLTSLESLCITKNRRLKELRIPETLTSLQTLTVGCFNLSELTLSGNLSSLTTLDIFSSGIRELTLSGDLSSLYDIKFPYVGISNLTKLTLSGILTSLETLNLLYFPKLTELNLSGTLTSFRSLNCRGCECLTKVTVSGAFASPLDIDLSACSNLTEFTIPETLTSIQVLNLHDCSNLPGLVIPDSLTSFETLDLEGCSRFRELRIPETLVSLKSLAVSSNALPDLRIPETLTSLESLKVSSRALSELIIPETLILLKNIDLNCPALRELHVPDTLTSLQNITLANSTSLSGLILAGTLISLETIHISSSNLSELVIPDTLSLLRDLKLESCISLTKLTLPETLTSLKSLTLRGCRMLPELTLPNTRTPLSVLDITGCTLTLKFNRALWQAIKNNPTLRRTLANNPGFQSYLSILDILDIRENSEESLDEKILELRSLIECNEKLSPLLPYLAKIEEKDLIEQLPLLKFVAYTAGLMLNLSDEQARFLIQSSYDSAAPASSQGVAIGDTLFHLIYEHKFGLHRYTLIDQAALIAERNPDYLKKMMTLENNWTKLAALTLGLREEKDDVERILQLIDKNESFKDNVYFNTLASFLCEFARNSIQYGEKGELIIKKLEEILRRKTDVILKTLSAYEDISVLYGKDEFLKCIGSDIDSQSYFAGKFETTFGITGIENCSEKYRNTFDKFRDPQAIFTYFARLNQISEPNERQSVKECFKQYITSVLEDKFHELRYNSETSPHLHKVFGGARGDAAKEAWKNNIPQEELSGEIKELQVDYKRIFDDWIKRDSIIPKSRFLRFHRYLAGEKVDLPSRSDNLKKLFQSQICEFCGRKPNAQAWKKFENNVIKNAQFKEILPDELKKRLTPFPKDLESLKAILKETLNPIEFSGLIKFFNTGEKVKVDGPEDKYENLLMELCLGQIKITDFLQRSDKKEFDNIKNPFLKAAIETLRPPPSQSKFTIMETDDPCDLLMIGTEVRRSCQSVDGEAENNKSLVSFLMNGEIKAIVVKAGKKIVARSLIRLMWDSKNNRPVILQEKIYNNMVGNEAIEIKINEWAVKKAKEMKCPLVGTENKECPAYRGKVEFLGGFAPVTYSDAADGVRRGPYETGGCRVLWKPTTER